MRKCVGLLAYALLACASARADTFVVTNSADSGEGTLRWAWNASNTNPGPDTIAFNLSTGGLQTITLLSGLGDAIGPVTIDGYSQSGFSNRPIVEVSGQGIGSFPDYGFSFSSHGNVVRGLIINNFNSGGIEFISGSSSNKVTGCWIGVDAGGTLNRRNGNGIAILGGSSNIIGGTNAVDRNVIAGSIRHGIHVSYGMGNVIQGNYIGTDVTGANALGNGYAINGDGNTAAGIYVEGGGTNIIGGDAPGAGNLISGNVRGIALYTGTRGNIIQGNIIGLDAAGAARPPGTYQLLGIDGSPAYDTIIGGTNAAARNIISANGRTGDLNSGHGIRLGSSTGNVVRGNFIGTDAAGMQPQPNLGEGIYLENNANANLIGGTASGAGNLISGNRSRGITIRQSHRNTIQGNAIGTQSNRMGALGNTAGGVFIFEGKGNLVGGTLAGAPNVIAFNRNTIGNGHGVFLSGEGANALTTNTVSRNSIFDNAGLGIRLFNISCFTCNPFNDPGDADNGPNRLQNFPVLAKAVTSAGTINITGMLHSAASSSFTIEFYASPTVDPSGFGEGRTYLGNTTISTDGSGDGFFDKYFNLLDPGVSSQFITALAIDAGGNSSEFSAAIIADSTDGALVFEADASQVAESAGLANIGVRRIAGTSGVVTVGFSVSEGTATAGSDFAATNGVLSFADGETYKTIGVSIVSDSANELAETVLLSLGVPTGDAVLVSPSNHILTIVDDDPLYAYAIDAAVTKPTSGSTILAMPVTLSSPPPDAVTATVSYATANLTAVAGTDYLQATGTLAFISGVTQQFVNVTVLADGLQEGSKAFQLTLSNPSNALLADVSSVGTIYDGTQGVLQFSTNVWTVAENAAAITISVARVGGMLGVVSVPFAVNAGSASAPADFILTNGTLSFANAVASRTFAVQINNDVAMEGPETVALDLGTPANTTLGSPASATLTIIDDEPLPQLLVHPGTNAPVIRWDTNAADFKLHATVDISPASWTPVSNTPAINGGLFQVIEPSFSNRFYRLIR